MPPRRPYDVVVIGAGILGLATARSLLDASQRRRVLVLEKENDVATHQSGRNSGVIHAGVYYAPGTLKARLAVQGNASLVRFCDEHGIPYRRCGKLIAAADGRELPALEALHERAVGNGVAAHRLRPEEAVEREPHLTCVAALYIPSTGIVDFGEVSRRYAELFAERGGEVEFGARARRVVRNGRLNVIETETGEVSARFVVNCAGLQSDRVAAASGFGVAARIVPFRGEYLRLRRDRSHLVKGLIYPVPDPRLPFLGIHATRGIDGIVHLGPNAVLAFKREGYERRAVNLRDTAATLGFPGFWRFLGKHPRAASVESYRSLRRKAFVAAARRLLPELRSEDLTDRHAGIRAQAVLRDGRLADDFLLAGDHASVHVLNAPSPGATASLEIGAELARRVGRAMD